MHFIREDHHPFVPGKDNIYGINFFFLHFWIMAIYIIGKLCLFL